MKLPGKKSIARSVLVTPAALAAVKKLYKLKGSPGRKAVMFEPGLGKNLVNKWVQRVTGFFKRRGEKVTTHDFRVSTGTRFYNKHKDIMAVKEYLGQKDVRVTQRYIRKEKEEVLVKAGQLFESMF